MSETAKTCTYVAVAVAGVLLAAVTLPRAPEAASNRPTAGTILNAVEDPLSATRLTVVKYDENTSSLKNFEVAQIDGLWAIPSHENYPADADRQLAEAATSVMNLTILDEISTNPADHVTYGVVDPDVDKLEAGAVGVGTRVTMLNAKGDKLVTMVIGKEVKDQPGQRYVREVGRDPVYVVKMDPSKLSTRFEDWIEEDLLKVNPWDIQEVSLKDYSVSLGISPDGRPHVVWDRREEMTFAYDDSASKWDVKDLQTFDKDQRVLRPFTLAEDEEVNKDKLNELKNALDDLKIVDVERKPDGLSRDLKAAKDFADNDQAKRNLAERGFLPVQVNGEFEVLSSEGEVLCHMKDGVEYVLRFGELVLGSETATEKAEEKETAEGESQDSGESRTGVNRYVFVMARFNEDRIERPKLEELPALPESAKPESAKAEQPKAEESKTEETKTEKASDSPAPGGSPKEEAVPAEEAKPAAKEADSQAAAPAEGSGQEKKDPEVEKIIEKRKEIEKENQRKLDEYQEKLKQGRDRVKELNDRFGDWYYVISDSVFKKIHLGRDDVIKTKEKKEGEADKEDAAAKAEEASPQGTLDALEEANQ